MFAVLTIDIVGSRKFTSQQRVDVDKRIKHVLALIHKEFSPDLKTPFSVTLGDEYQGIIKNPEKAPEVILALRTGIMMSPTSLDFKPQLRISVGVGEIYIHRGNLSRQHDGPSFWLSRKAMSEAKDQKHMTMYALSDDKLTQMINTTALLMDAVSSRWTRKHCEAIWYRRQGYSLQEIARRVSRRTRRKVTLQAINYRLKAAKWDAYDTGTQQVKILLEEFISNAQKHSSA